MIRQKFLIWAYSFWRCSAILAVKRSDFQVLNCVIMSLAWSVPKVVSRIFWEFLDWKS